MGTQRVQMEGVLPWVVLWALQAGTRDFYPAVPALVGPVRNIFSYIRILFQLICPHRPARWAGNRAG